MRFVIWFLAGLAAAAVQTAGLELTRWIPDLRVLVLAFLLLRLPTTGLGMRVFGFLIGFSAASMEPLGESWIGAGLSALILLAVRDLLYVNKWAIQILGTAVVSWMFLVAREFVILAAAEPAARSLVPAVLALTAAVSPVFQSLAVAIARLVPGVVIPPFPVENVRDFGAVPG